MAKSDRPLIQADENDKKSVQELLEMRKEHEQALGELNQSLEAALQKEFHQVWGDTIKPALEHLKDTTQELLKRFSDFEDDFRGYLREKEPDVDIDLLEEIYGDTLKSKARTSTDKKALVE